MPQSITLECFRGTAALCNLALVTTKESQIKSVGKKNHNVLEDPSCILIQRCRKGG
jgi:hypothetical protein